MDIVLDVEETVVLGLKVTVLCDLGEFGGLRIVFVGGGTSGDLSVDAEAIANGCSGWYGLLKTARTS